VSNVGIDNGCLSWTAGKSRDEVEAETIEILTERAYFKSEELAASETAGIEAYVVSP
jgi:hypothetical protein